MLVINIYISREIRTRDFYYDFNLYISSLKSSYHS